MSYHTLNCPPLVLGNLSKNRTCYRTRLKPSAAVQLYSLLVQSDESGNYPATKSNLGSNASLVKCLLTPSSLLSQSNTVGVIGGVSAFSTLIFLEKLVWWSSRHGEECLPFVVCSDSVLNRELSDRSSFRLFDRKCCQIEYNHGLIVENLRHKRAFLEQSGARCIVMPCHLSHAWHGEISQDCSVPFFHVGKCVASDLKEAKFKPIEAGSDVRIGLLATDATLTAGFYQEKLQSQGFEVVLPDKATMENILIPAMDARHRGDMEGARILLSIAIQVLLVRAVNTVILATDELQGLLPHNDRLLKKCIDPMDALARSTIKWAKSIEKVHDKNIT
ncbi:Asp_Glu_race domain-containing protein [Cephalotus follicularis]|uniref:Asp_Glu_race domain-containing protein n=1 Tax=Cephalotus follicularis TaxID=3775 RepID=A0A1Q3D3U6_CEPFO|nr:Asp_Glu_race domain-containing protein [Cephalotus follicularis]